MNNHTLFLSKKHKKNIKKITFIVDNKGVREYYIKVRERETKTKTSQGAR